MRKLARDEKLKMEDGRSRIVREQIDTRFLILSPDRNKSIPAFYLEPR
jgi:hypothetical protein